MREQKKAWKEVEEQETQTQKKQFSSQNKNVLWEDKRDKVHTPM
jgi:hypothetical protein